MFPQGFPKLPCCLIFAALSMVSESFALRIDEFNGGSQEAISERAEPLNPPTIEAVNTSSALGGARVVTALATQGSVGGRVSGRVAIAGTGSFFHSQDSTVSGVTSIIWDGGTDGVPNGAGLRGGLGINLLQDQPPSPGEPAKLQLSLASFDLPGGGQSGIVTIVLTLYDVSDPSGLFIFSTASHQLLQSGSQLIEFTAADFAPGPVGPADWTRIGAIMLTVNGAAPDADLQLGFLKTNGLCDLVPDSQGKVIDECGVCGGDNSSCSDCEGVPNGAALPGTTCSTGQPGICASGSYNEQCGCVGPLPKNEVCDGLDNNCDGAIDESFPQLGQACAVGAGICAEEGQFVCGSGGGVRCDADVREPDVLACEASKGCDGVPNSGLVVDQCNVCGGNGDSCKDCEGTPFGSAQVDRCNVCNGDGNSCLGCTEFDLNAILTALDGGAKEQERTVRRILGQLSRVKVGSRDRKRIAEIRSVTHRLQIRNWTLAWTVPAITTSCTNVQFCAATSSAWVIAEYRKNSEELRQLAIQSEKLVRRLRKGSFPAGKKLLSIADQQHARNMALADTVPLENFSCT